MNIAILIIGLVQLALTIAYERLDERLTEVENRMK